RATRPNGSVEWAAEAVRTIVDREITVAIPGRSGQGEMWSASWRWWNDRPRAAVAFSAPKIRPFPGIWRVDGSWEAQTYAFDDANGTAPFRQESMHGGLAVSDWLTAGIRYELRAGVDSWTDMGRAASLGGAIERRLFSDRVSIEVSGTAWLPVTTASGFHAVEIHTTYRSSPAFSGTTYAVDGGA